MRLCHFIGFLLTLLISGSSVIAQEPVIPVWPGAAPGSEDCKQQEVEYLDNYIALQQLRFGRDMEILFDKQLSPDISDYRSLRFWPVFLFLQRHSFQTLRRYRLPGARLYRKKNRG